MKTDISGIYEFWTLASIEVSDIIPDSMPCRLVTFMTQNSIPISYMILYSSHFPMQIEQTEELPEGYRLVSLGLATSHDGSVNSIDFKISKV